MQRTMASAIAACILAAIPAHAQQSPVELTVMPVDSMDGFMAWLKSPQGMFPRMKEALPGKKVWFPIVVTGLHPPAHGEMRLVADLELFAPDGHSLASMPQCCSYTITDRPDILTAVLGPTMNVEFDAREPKGVYTVRVSVNDGSGTLKASNTFRLGGAAAADDAASTRRMETIALPHGPDAREESGRPPKDIPPAPRRTFPHADRTECLDLPTPAEVIRCSEKK